MIKILRQHGVVHKHRIYPFLIRTKDGNVSLKYKFHILFDENRFAERADHRIKHIILLRFPFVVQLVVIFLCNKHGVREVHAIVGVNIGNRNKWNTLLRFWRCLVVSVCNANTHFPQLHFLPCAKLSHHWCDNLVATFSFSHNLRLCRRLRHNSFFHLRLHLIPSQLFCISPISWFASLLSRDSSA